MLSRKPRLRLETLESRLVPAFNSLFDGSTLTLTQTADDGAVTVQTTGTSVVVTEGANTFTLGVNPSSLTVNLLGGTNALTVDLDGALSGNMSLNLGSGSRTTTFTGDANSIAGNLTIRGGTGDQRVDLTTAASAGMVVGGTLSADLGLGFDNLQHDDNDLTVGSDLSMTGVNIFDSLPDDDAPTLIVGRNLSMTVANDDNAGILFLDDLLALSVGGNVTFLGGSRGDEGVIIRGSITASIGGNVNVNLGAGLTGTTQAVFMDDVTVGGSLIVVSGLTLAGSFDVVDLNTDGNLGTVIGGNISLNLGGGDNIANLVGTFGGSSVSYTGGANVDSLTWGMTGNRARVTATLGAGNDDVTILAGSPPAYLYVDFGAGVDTFTNGAGAFPFFLLNLP